MEELKVCVAKAKQPRQDYLDHWASDTDGDDERHRRADEYNSLLTRVNSAVSTVNLLGETAAPLAAGLILTIPYSFRVPDSSMDVDVGGVIVAGIGTLSPLLACLVLMRVFRSAKRPFKYNTLYKNGWLCQCPVSLWV